MIAFTPYYGMKRKLLLASTVFLSENGSIVASASYLVLLRSCVRVVVNEYSILMWTVT